MKRSKKNLKKTLLHRLRNLTSSKSMKRKRITKRQRTKRQRTKRQRTKRQRGGMPNGRGARKTPRKTLEARKTPRAGKTPGNLKSKKKAAALAAKEEAAKYRILEEGEKWPKGGEVLPNGTVVNGYTVHNAVVQNDFELYNMLSMGAYHNTKMYGDAQPRHSVEKRYKEMHSGQDTP